MSERRVRDAVIEKSEGDIDLLMRPITRAVGEAVRKHEKITPFARLQIMAEVDAQLAHVFGFQPGDPNAEMFIALSKRIIESEARARQVQQADVRSKLKKAPSVLHAIERK